MASLHDGKVAVVTGAASGIGQACAIRLAEDGADVAIADIKPAAETARRIESAGRRALAVECDITDPAQTAAFVRRVEDRLGRCDILFNNAGAYAFSSIEDLSFEAWRRYMALNVDAVFLMAKAFVPGMKARGWGRIINIASNSFVVYVPNMAHYVATKGAVIGFTRGLASDLGDHGVTVNAVAPGPTVTEGVRAGFFEQSGTRDEAAFQAFVGGISQNQAIKRAGEPSDVAGVVSFLASDDAKFVTGQTIIIDGGGARL